MTVKVPESDWKKFRKFREVALERLCDRILQEIASLSADDSISVHQRYLKIYKLVREQNRELARLFDDLRRSQMLLQLCGMYALGLLKADELDEFTSETRDRVKIMVE